MEIKTSEEISKKYQELTRITPTDDRYIWRTQIKWIRLDELKERLHQVQEMKISYEEFLKELTEKVDGKENGR